jgi:hypothetical protein
MLTPSTVAVYTAKERVSALPEFGPLCVPFFTSPDLTSEEAEQMRAKYIDDFTRMLHCHGMRFSVCLPSSQGLSLCAR